MSVSEPFIRRPVGTTLLALGLLVLGLVAYRFLPVASLPSVDLPTILVVASRPGADPATMAESIAAPLERRLGAIAGINEITSVSSLGETRIILQFDFGRSVDGAASDVQAALNASATDLPSDLTTAPAFYKLNPASAPVLILALTADTLDPSQLYDTADTVIAQRLAQVPGVGQVSASGADQPAVRVRLDPDRLAAMGLSTESVRTTIADGGVLGPVGSLDGPAGGLALSLNAQLRDPKDYAAVLLRAGDGTSVRLGDVATVDEGVRNTRAGAWYNGKPAVLLNVTRQPGANVNQVIDGIKDALPELQARIPAGVHIDTLTDRTVTIRSSVDEMEGTLAATIALVMVVVFVFLRRLVPTLAAGVTVPLSLSGTFAAMWASGFSIDNLSLLALAVSVGLVVDDAIVMIENIYGNVEAGVPPLKAAADGARQIGFTIISISVSLLAAFIPLFFIGGIVGPFFREFTLTLSYTIVISTIVAVTVTPMVCAHFLRPGSAAPRGRLDRVVEAGLDRIAALYARSLRVLLPHRWLMLLVTIGAAVLTGFLYVHVPKGFVPDDDTGLIQANTRAAPDIAYPAMVTLQARVAGLIASDPAVAAVGSSLGGGFFGSSVNTGQVYASLVPPESRPPVAEVVERLRRRLARVPGVSTYLNVPQDLRSGARSSDAAYQFTLWDADYGELVQVAPRLLDLLKHQPLLTDVSADRQASGLEATITVDREAAARLGVRISDVDAVLNNAFAQRQVVPLYGTRNQYHVVLEVPATYAPDPQRLLDLHVPSSLATPAVVQAASAAAGTGAAPATVAAAVQTAAQVPLSAVATIERGSAPLTVNHQGQYPSVTISYNLKPDTTLDAASTAIEAAVAGLHLPAGLHAEPAGDAKSFGQSSSSQPLLLLTAILAIYIVLGVLYESLAHPLTILSTLPSAGLGALLALEVTGSELTLIAFIGIMLLVGIVKKNGIMLVDFALEQERRHGMAPREAIVEACLKRFRPILMTTMAALLGAVPLIVASGPGSALRQPLGITIVGGLVVSQVLTLYTTPAIYLMLSGLHRRLSPRSRTDPARGVPAWRAPPVPAE